MGESTSRAGGQRESESEWDEHRHRHHHKLHKFEQAVTALPLDAVIEVAGLKKNPVSKVAILGRAWVNLEVRGSRGLGDRITSSLQD